MIPAVLKMFIKHLSNKRSVKQTGVSDGCR
jgi:hypothetical protein